MARKDEYKATEYPGIKQRIKDGKYLVVIDLGRQPRLDKKTGLVVQKQCKTQKIFDKLKDARAYQAENTKAKKDDKVTRIAGKVLFKDAVADYNAMYSAGWGASYAAQKKNQERRMIAYFGNTDVRQIDTLAIEKFFEWCRTPNSVYTTPLSNNTIEKYKTHMKDIWKFMKKGKKYGVTENVVIDADVGKIDGFEAQILDVESVKYFLWYITHCEKDYSVFSLFAIPALSGLRRGELCGLKWKDIDFENKVIDVAQQRMQAGSGTIIKVPKNGDDNGKNRKERRQRYSVISDVLGELLLKVKEQQTEILGTEPSADDYVYRTKMNLVRGDLPRPGKVSKRFKELRVRCNKVRTLQNLEPLPEIRLHDLRHTFISLCINGGVSPLKVSVNCGHFFIENEDDKPVKPTTTTATYYHDDYDRTEIRDFLNKTFANVDISTPDLSESIFDNLCIE